MAEAIKIPLLEAEDIECRVQSVSRTKKGDVGAVLLVYKDARVDMKILDQVYGPNNWQRTHEVIDGTLYCNIDIWDKEKQCWVRKQDAGVESNTEKQKGRASDSFKRAGFNVGIGRELYTAPFIWIRLNDGEYYSQKQNNRDVYKCTARFEVAQIGYDDRRRINALTIVDQNGNERYTLRAPQQPARQQTDNRQQTTRKEAEKPAEQPQGAAQSTEPQPTTYYCESCYMPILETVGKKGRLWMPAEIVSLSKETYGKVLCPDCQKTQLKRDREESMSGIG